MTLSPAGPTSNFKSDSDAGEMQFIASSRKPMIPGLIVKRYTSQSIANQGSKFQSEVSPEVSPEMW
jgi:hypothetical protein